MFAVTLELEDLDENKILVKLARNKLFKIEKFYLFNQWDTDGSTRTLTIYVDVEDRKKAEEEMGKFLDLLNFMFDIDLTISTSFYFESDDLPTSVYVIAENANNNNIKKINELFTHILSLDSKKQKLIHQSLHYYSRSLKLFELELYEDAFLTAYKPIELISNNVYKYQYQTDFNLAISSVMPNLLKELFDEEFKEEGKDCEINNLIVPMLEGILTQRRKIKNTLLFLKMESEEKHCGKLVSLRNKVGAHATSGGKKIGMYEYVDCRVLSKKIITAYILGEPSDISDLDMERKCWWELLKK